MPGREQGARLEVIVRRNQTGQFSGRSDGKIHTLGRCITMCADAVSDALSGRRDVLLAGSSGGGGIASCWRVGVRDAAGEAGGSGKDAGKRLDQTGAEESA